VLQLPLCLPFCGLLSAAYLVSMVLLFWSSSGKVHLPPGGCKEAGGVATFEQHRGVPPVRQRVSGKSSVWQRISARPPVWQRLSNMDMDCSPVGRYQEPPRHKISVWKHLAASHDQATLEANTEEDKKMCSRPMQKKVFQARERYN
jgi:hypothetical protein